LKKNQKAGINAKKSDGNEYIKISEKDIIDLCLTAQDIFANQPIFLELQPPVKIVGDIHGQFSDMRKIFDMEGWPPEANYLFLGDYQGRGPMQVETVLLLLAFKVKYPENFFMLRGNHECHSLAYIYGFNKALLEWEGKSKVALAGNN
jgi:serine/threonine-protein phosphatase PP1 catalytic subunit